MKQAQLEKLQSLIDGSHNIVFLGGAGVSTESGIPDFRGKNGLYKQKTAYGSRVTPEYLLSSDCLYHEPELFFDNYRKNLNCLDAKPNATHLYLKQLEDAGKLRAIITQNIDGLHQKAGSKNVFEIHGTLWDCHCTKCNRYYSCETIFHSTGVPKCDCGGMIRPDIVLFGELLPEDYTNSRSYMAQADLLIIAGTSLQVLTAVSLIDSFKGAHMVIINDAPTPLDDMAELVIRTPLGEVFSRLTA
ncbi:MAG: NAD-dependent protein deacylase [Lachnospiraceae bacterium]|nr:NAD-dependent protein deacylase [Lachnospiraceae bacterium]